MGLLSRDADLGRHDAILAAAYSDPQKLPVGADGGDLGRPGDTQYVREINVRKEFSGAVKKGRPSGHMVVGDVPLSGGPHRRAFSEPRSARGPDRRVKPGHHAFLLHIQLDDFLASTGQHETSVLADGYPDPRLAWNPRVARFAGAPHDPFHGVYHPPLVSSVRHA